MMAAWMVYALVVSALVGLAAGGFEAVCRATRLPSRFVWVAAVLASVVLVGLAPFRAPLQPSETAASGVELPVLAGSVVDEAPLAGQGSWLSAPVRSIRHAI
jgi:hypothetical protein